MPTRRTRVVGWLRVVLPLAALALLSGLFLLARRPAPAPVTPSPAAEAAPGLVAPSWAGTTPDGASLTLRARTAGMSGDGGTAEGVEADWRGIDGLRAALRAPRAEVGDDALRLSGGVTVETSSGWRLAADALDAATDRSALAAEGGLTASAPFGTIDAGAVTLARTGDHHVLNFTGGVRLVYRP